MASSSGKKESTFFLWIIIPACVLLTLLFSSIGHYMKPAKHVLDGNRPTSALELMEKSKSGTETVHSDTLAADSTAVGHQAH